MPVYRQEYSYLGPSSELPREQVKTMERSAKRLTYQYFISRVPVTVLKDLLEDAYWNNGKFAIHVKHDPSIRFYSSKFEGSQCMYVDYRGVKHIFVTN